MYGIKISCIIFCIIFTTLIATTTSSSQFQAQYEDTRITGIQPFFELKNMASMAKCHIICYNVDKCLYVELSKQEDYTTTAPDQWTCRLFDIPNDVDTFLKLSPGTVISSPRAKRDCLGWFRQGFKRDGVYYISFQGQKRKV